MSSKLLKGLFVLSLFTIFGLYEAKSQALSQYVASESIGTWTPITGTQIEDGGDDDETPLTSIGFTFPFDNRTFTTFSASTNGYVSLGRVQGSYNAAPGSSSTASNDMLAIMNSDNYVAGGNIAYEVQGSAPNRVCVVQWTGFYGYGGTNINASMQVRMYESGKIEYIYGPNMTLIHRSEYIYLGGAYPTYIRVQPGTPSLMAYGTTSNNTACVTTANRDLLVPGKTYTFVGYPVLRDAYPANESIVMVGMTYGSPNGNHPGYYVDNYISTFSTFVSYSIEGPGDASNPAYSVIYRAVNPALPSTDEAYYNVPVTSGGQTRIANAIGIAAGANGALDLATNSSQITPGLYKVKAVMKIPSVNYQQTITYNLNIAYQRDLAIASINSPKSNVSSKYPLNTSLPVVVSYANLGVNAINRFNSNVRIYFENETTPIYNETILWDTNYVIGRGPLALQGITQIEFPTIMPTRGIGHYRVEIVANLQNPSPDDQLSNNVYPQTGSTYYFDLAYDLELEATNITVPQSTISLGRPIIPQGQLKNNGISDVPYQVPAKFEIFNSSNVSVYNEVVYLDAIPAYPSGVITTFDMKANYIPTVSGTYTAVITITATDDPIVSNNTFTKTFTVLPGLTGTYTIGSVKPGIDVSRNYLTIEEAVRDLYLKGISGSVIFEFTDKNYTANSLTLTSPAIDLSSTIIGNDATNTITFRPNAVNSLNFGDVVINLNSLNGIGVLFGQSSNPTYTESAIYSVLPSLKKEYANGANYIKFDGGSNTSLKFVLNTASDFKACFYLGQGASNNTIKNCIIEDGSTNADNTTLPMTRYNASNREFEFEADNNTNGTYSAGIVMRSIAPYDAKQFMLGKLENPYKLDTLSNDNNIISNNTISGFGYGIVSLGIGVLEKVEQGIGVHKKFYNTGNEIKNNTIYNVNRAGLFLGFEHNSLIEGNRIYNVFNLNGSGAVGIMAGSDPLNNYFGYNNIGLKINANEISGVNTNLLGAGISVTQSQNSYPNVSSSEFVTFPDVAETMVIANNAIWGFVGQTAADQKAGIVLQTGRASDNFSPAVATYRTRNDVIANNTIIMNEDGLASGPDIYGMLIEQTENTKIVNNAIAISDNTYSSDNVSALLCYYGELPKAANVVFDRNVYWSTSTTNTDLARLIEAKSDASVLQVSKDGDIRNLGQWQIMTEQDANSTMYNFINDVMVTTTNKLRIKTSPSLPIGSKLNNNGYRFNEIVINDNTTLLDKIAQTDLTGILRGVAGTRVDIGALEFTGEVRHRDLEVVQITSPAVYKSALGEFSDNQYVMTTAPVEIKALLRNNGNYPQNNVTVMAVVYRQWPDGQYENGGLVIADTFLTYVNIASYDNVEVNFNTASGEGYDFVPETYSDLRTAAYTAPVKYGQMVTNVTPIYKIVVSVETDMDNTNNNKAESYRFYIKRSTLNMLVSAENITADKGSLTLTNDQLAGRLNYDSLKKAINRLGWYQETMTEPKDYHFDAFDRNVWEPKAVNYAMYKNLFWSDGDDKSIARQTEKDIRSFISNGANGFKKNLVVASQEMLRMNLDKSDFTQNILKAVNKAPYSPLNGASYADHRVIGSALSIGKVETILSTGFTSGTLTDIEPNPALMGTPSTSSLTYAAYVFQTKDVSATDSLAGVATSELTQNVIYLGIDWRHWGNLDTLLRGITDYNTRNGSKIEVPIELIDFDAIALNNRVELSWSTASEINTDRFEIERALLSQSGMSNFSVIAEEVAAGNSASTRSYGPVIDRNVAGGATYVYRLRTIDLDGASSLSDEVEVTIDAVNTLGTINPNPAASTVKLDFNANSDVVITIYDMNGKLVKEIFNGTASGNMNISFEVNDLASGSYTIVMQAGKEFYSRQLYVRK